jgi:hypothetical protein
MAAAAKFQKRRALGGADVGVLHSAPCCDQIASRVARRMAQIGKKRIRPKIVENRKKVRKIAEISNFLFFVSRFHVISDAR